MASLDTPQTTAADATLDQLIAELGLDTAAGTPGDLVIQDLDHCAAVTPAWTYCG